MGIYFGSMSMGCDIIMRSQLSRVNKNFRLIAVGYFGNFIDRVNITGNIGNACHCYKVYLAPVFRQFLFQIIKQQTARLIDLYMIDLEIFFRQGRSLE